MDDQQRNEEMGQGGGDVAVPSPADAVGELEALKRERDEYLAGWKRAQADYANLRREADREKAEFAKYATERFLEDLLPSIDHFETALMYVPSLDGVPEDARKRLDGWIAGIKAVKALWSAAFQQVGLEPVPVDGAFDPMLHEAVGEEAVDGRSAGSVARVVMPGWRLNGKLLRPAKVVVAK